MTSGYSNKSKRIAKNTLFLYFRMFFLMLVSLYTSRVVLKGLGVEDYGIYNVVGGFVSMFSLISSSLTSASSRFLNYEMGKGNLKSQNVVFSTIVTIQYALALVVFIISEAFGIYYINNIMVLSAERLNAANWCFQFSVINFCMHLITVPYNASIIAHEKMKAYAYASVFEGLAKLAISFIIYFEPFDRLIYYAFLLLVVQFSVRCFYQYYCRRNFEECNYKRVFDKPLLMKMLSYSSWHLIGNGASVLKIHGVNVVLNIFCGPALNTARGLANQIDGAVSNFAGNFMMAMNPQITQSYASGDLRYMLNLVNKGARMSFFMVFILSMPILINTHYILELWLGDIPDYTVIFTQLTLVVLMLNTLSKPLITAQNATGNVRDYQLIVGGIYLLNMPLCFWFLHLGFNPEVIVYVAIFVEIIALFARMYMIPLTIPEFSSWQFLNDVAKRCAIVTVVSLPVPLLLYHYMAENFYSFTLNTIVTFFISIITVLYLGCSKDERKTLFEAAKKIHNKIKS